MIVHRVEPVDSLDLGDEIVVLYAHSLVRLSPLAASIFELAEGGIELDRLAAELAALYGSPDGDDPVSATSHAVADLVEQGVLRRSEDATAAGAEDPA